MPCEVCHDLSFKADRNWDSEVGQIEKSASSGCTGCLVISTGFRAIQAKGWEEACIRRPMGSVSEIRPRGNPGSQPLRLKSIAMKISSPYSWDRLSYEDAELFIPKGEAPPYFVHALALRVPVAHGTD